MRRDIKYKQKQTFLETLQEISRVTFMPLTVGGGIRTLEDIEIRLRYGADKVVLNSVLHENCGFVSEAVANFGSQCIVAMCDYRLTGCGAEVFLHGGEVGTGVSVKDWCKSAVDLGVGEIVVQNIDLDGSGKGYDLEILSQVSEYCSIPVLGCGGAGNWGHIEQLLENTSVDAAVVGNIFQHNDQSVFLCKQYLVERGCNIRPPELFEVL